MIILKMILGCVWFGVQVVVLGIAFMFKILATPYLLVQKWLAI
jgi:hypothetical protein